MSNSHPAHWYAAWGKRLLDVLLALPLAVLTLPLLLLAAGALAVQNRGAVLFRQLRPGHHGALFPLYKLQTMTNARDAHGQLLPDADRLTRLGRWLRATSVDELPQLWNVLRGDISLVGPRPLLPQYLPLYSPEQARRHLVKPGITGWAQVNGRNAISWEQKFIYDVWYVDNLSLALDLRILGRTVRRVLSARGISAPGQATTEAFRGSSPFSSPNTPI
ncbi:Sugar transferase involved in LPS biosynthesis (colanic, teichoic acid) [Hymenobacter daecheongensis DSM 21074]|uniref:Sugar transferase involved in LPS biosynthesis (Colanic, teichoic acid) n=1 Tax=Hymenobacter daecheongensis DSM 21074 TaxID=1121955 RepID=A0A1M6GN01_9BACT|nr:sugar transferase [Hymenobacter daecheongensis]SHJ11289.1 Sugar transferase involved in LPS biosynthesis (colanic, teichoic acid) [Hymenobacter daecheongensis DSM 21074]